jgi:predicted TIM-barrel fold metal-dependent hydrolase
MSSNTAGGGSTHNIPAIDVHGHYGAYDRGPGHPFNTYMSADAAAVAARAAHARIRLTIVSPLRGLMPRGSGDAVAGNQEAARLVQDVPGLRQYVILDPRRADTYRQADALLGQPFCVGIKLHPEEHVYPIREHGRMLFSFAARHRAIVLCHTSEQLSLAMDFAAFANDFPETTVILAHLGHGWDGDPTHQVRAVQSSRHGNVYVDTSSARSITPNLIEWAVGEIGADRILFGTDTPLYHAGMQRARIDFAEIPESDRRKILHENAERLFGFEPA